MAMSEDAEPAAPLADLFSKKHNKPSANYDYSVVPSRGRRDPSPSDGEEETADQPKRKKPKSGLRGKRKRAEAEAAAGITGDDTAGQESHAKVGKTDNVKEAAIEAQKHDRMAQVKHEDSKEKKLDPEKEERTVYIGNLPISHTKKDLKKMLAEFGKIEAVRFRCAARPDMKTTKKVAVIKKTFHEERSSIAAYVRFAEKQEAVAATGLNGQELEGHVVRVDLALAATSHDNKKAVFLGNLDFKVQEDEVRTLFAKCGEIESVRLVRDKTTGIGKGFGYVNFVEAEAVELALRLINQEVAGRKVRVTRAVRKAKPGKLIVSKTEQKSKNKSKGTPKSDKKSKVKTSSRSQGHDKRSKGFRKIKDDSKSFQGVSTTLEKPKKIKKNKTEKRNQILAEKLAA
jgi:nucleolar protein 12